MSCVSLNKGLNNCVKGAVKYYQECVLINSKDVDNYVFRINDFEHSISFNLKEDKKGHTLKSPDNTSAIFGEFSKSSIYGLPEYTHVVLLPIMNNTENFKSFLRVLDEGDVILALMDYSNQVEIFGWDYGMRTKDGYNFSITDGHVIVEMESTNEREIPFVYKSKSNAVNDFNNEFLNIPNPNIGDYNNDYNNDFFIGNE